MSDALPLSALDLSGGVLIAGELVQSQTDETLEVSSPIDGTTISAVPASGPEEVDIAVSSAVRAFESGGWARADAAVRKRTLTTWAALLESKTEQLASLITHEMGKPIDEARGEVAGAVNCLSFYAEAVDKLYGDVVPVTTDAFTFVASEPVGVVGAVTPWNYPLNMPMWKLAPALAAGNSVVLKPAEQTPLIALRMAELATEAGLPDGVLAVVPGDGPRAGAALGLHPRVAALSFTGSTEIGKRFLSYSAASNMKAVWLECGGKSAQIVLDDVLDIEAAAREVAAGIFTNAGQVCNAGSRVLVQPAVKQPLLDALSALTEQYRPSDPRRAGASMGPLVEEAQLQRYLHYIDQGRAAGADLLVGGERALIDTGGYYAEPTVFVNATSDMSIAQDEIFGPVLTVIDVIDVEQAVAVANGTRYGLAASVWTRDVSRAHRVARSLRAGNIWVNTFDRGSMALPFGGYGESGIGVDRSMRAVAKYQHLKSTWIAL